MFKNLIRKTKENRGFTLMEVMVVVAILAVVVLIAVPSVIKMRKDMKFAERNDYAKSIYMAAQSNLTQMRSMGELGMLEQVPAAEQTAAVWAGANYKYTIPGTKAYDLVVPSSLDATIRNQQVVVEYHPKAGIVYAVYYHEGDETLASLYADTSIDLRTEEAQREYEVGYYCVGSVDALEGEALQVSRTSASVSYENGQKGIITVTIPMTDEKHNNIFAESENLNDPYGHYIAGLEVTLTINAENILLKNGAPLNSGTFQVGFKGSDANHVGKFAKDITNYSIVVSIPLDSLTSNGSFNLIPENKSASSSVNAILAGDNISVTADVTYYPTATDPIVMIESATIAGINPMYHSLTQNPDYNTEPNATNTEKPYILAVSNGRHLQNLSHLDAEFAQNIQSIVFTQQAQAPTQSGSGSNAGSTDESQPANEPNPAAETGATASGNLTLNWKATSDAYSGLPFKPIELYQPTVTNPHVPFILGNGVTIQNLNITAAENAGLFAVLKDTKIQDITLDNTNTISGGKNTGALAGSAEGATIENCETAAVVTGADSNACHVGGLVGRAKATGFLDCDAEGLKLSSGKNAYTQTVEGGNITYVKGSLGGIVGYADEGTTLTSCQSHSTSSITSAEGALSDLGGVVGYAKGTTFTNCSSWAKVNGTDADPSADKISIPNNNLGGFVGYSVNSTYTTTQGTYSTVTLGYMPQYAMDAGIFAGVIHGGKVENLHVEIDKNESSFGTVTNFGCIASSCNSSAVFDNIDVVIGDSIIATTRAGGSFATTEGSAQISDVRVKLNSGTIQADQAAGFAVVNGSSVEIEESYVLGADGSKIAYNSSSSQNSTNGAAGFVLDNEGTIKRSFANVHMEGGNAFVSTSNGSIKDCYGWTWGSGSTKIAIAQKCSYSYFVNGKTNEMVFYEGLTKQGDKNNVSEPSSNIRDTKALSHEWAVELLNAGTKKSDGTIDEENAPWVKGNNGYSYPELKDRGHQGASNAPVEGDYPFGLLYEETYGTETGYLLIPLSGNAPTHSNMPELDNGKEITDTHFYLYHITDSDISGTKHSYNKFDWLPLNQLYTIYELEPGNYTVDSKSFTTYYPLNSDGSLYKIRTPEQFGNIDKHSGSTFRIEKSMTVVKTIGSFDGIMEDSGEITITAANSLVGNLSGTLSGLTVTGLTKPMVGTVASNGKIENCVLTEVNITSGEKVGAFAGTLDGGTISGSSATGSVSGSNNVGGAIGYVKSGTVTDVTANVDVTATGDKAGMFVGYAEGGSFSNCKSTATTTTLPFGILKATTQTISATHSSAYNHTEDDYSTFDGKWIAVDKLQEDGSPVSVTLSTNDVEISKCYFNTDEPALKNPLYYYEIDQEPSFAKNQLVAFFDYIGRDTQTYDHFLPGTAESYDTWNEFDYYIRKDNSGSYNKLFVKVEKTNTESYSFSFGYDNNGTKTALKTVTVTNSTETIPDDVYLYVRNSTQIPTEGNYNEGKYVLYSGLGYLTFNSETGKFEWKIDFTSNACIDNIAALNLTKNESLNIDYALIYKYAEGDGIKTVPCDLYTFSATKHVKPVGHTVEINYPTT